MPSAYELLRESKIARNNARLSSLGLLNFTATRTKKRKRTAQSTTNTRSAPPTRRSARKRTTPSTSDGESLPAVYPGVRDLRWPTTVSSPPLRPVPTHISSHLSAVLPDPRPKTKFYNYHQHLQISRDGYTAATTGCAGYGVCTIHGDGDGTYGGTSSGSFTVRPLEFGTGGFAVGLVDASWRGPYKSLRKNPATAVAFYNSGEGGHHQVGGGFAGYREGDSIAVAWEKETVRLAINGKLATTAKIKEGKYVGAVQPFMGGVARLVA